MINYFPIEVVNLNTIREKILRLLPKYTMPFRSNFFYIPKEEIVKKKRNPKQSSEVKSDEPFVKTRKKTNKK